MAIVQVRGTGGRFVRSVPNVLMIGGAAYTTRFVTDLARQISASGRVTLSCLGLGDHEAARSEVDRGGFVHQFPMPPARPETVRQATRLIPALLRAAIMREPSGAAHASAHVRRPFRQTIARWMNAEQCRAALGGSLLDYDIYHYHSLETARMPVLWLLPPVARVVLSIWGSDLLRSAGTLEYVDQLAACERANIITVTSLEIREILLAKFGRHLAPKVRLALLGISLLDEIDRCAGHRRAFLESFGVPPDRVTICVGNNAGPGNQHMEVIARLTDLPQRYRSRIVLLVPLSYRPGNRDYTSALRAALEKGPLPYRMFDGALSDSEIAMLRHATDILIHVPVSDAFSAAMLETLYAGGHLITGAWLPYSELRRCHVSFDEIYTVDELTGAVAFALDNLAAKRRSAADNRPLVRALVHPTKTVQSWISIYNEFLGSDEMSAAS